jgi:hypothetical protein
LSRLLAEDGERIIWQQGIIVPMQREGRDASHSKRVLVVLHEAQALHASQRNRFPKELADI